MASTSLLVYWLLAGTFANAFAGAVGEVRSSDGSVVTGDVQSISDQSVIVSVDGENKTVDGQDVTAIVFPDVETRPPSTVVLRLRGGSVLPCTKIGLENDQIVVTPRRIEPFKLPIQNVASLRFAPSRPAADTSWLGYLSEPSTSDRMVIRRDGDVLDVVDGIIVSLDDESVKFEIDGDQINAPRERLEGIIWAGKPVTNRGTTVVLDAYGVRLRCTAVATVGNKLQCRIGDETISLSLNRIASVTRSGNLVSLGSLNPVQQNVSLPSLKNVDPAIVNKMFGLRMGDQPNTLTISGETKLEYRIPEDFSRLEGVCRRDPKSVAKTDMTIEISLDDKIVWTEAFENDGPRGFEIDVSDSRRVTIAVNGMDDGTFGDRVELSNVRFTK